MNGVKRGFAISDVQRFPDKDERSIVCQLCQMHNYLLK